MVTKWVTRRWAPLGPAVTSSYYKNAAGDLPTLYGFRIFDYWTWTNRANPDDYELRL